MTEPPTPGQQRISLEAIMTPAQRTAITTPCLLAFECAHPRYQRLASGGKVSVIVTVNSGYE